MTVRIHNIGPGPVEIIERATAKRACVEVGAYADFTPWLVVYPYPAAAADPVVSDPVVSDPAVSETA